MAGFLRFWPLFLAVFTLAFPVHAQLKVSEQEKAVFAFFKLAEHVPDYKSWAESMPDYKNASPELQPDIYNIEETRLKWGFGTYDPADEFLKIQTDAELILNETSDQTILHFRFPGSEGEEYPYFPYPYADAWIALVVSDLGHFTSLPLKPAEAQNIRKVLAGKTRTDVKMNMRVRPLEADIDEPLFLDGSYFWVMSGDIAYLDFVAVGAGETLFKYTAPWYLSDSEADLLELLK